MFGRSRLLHAAWLRFLDARDLVTGQQDPLVPPRSSIFIGAGDFRATGEAFLHHFIDIGHLSPDDTVLDVGCGIGRMAVPLTTYLSPSSAYHGIDIVPKGITWCRRHITARYPNFHFHHANVINRHYNPSGAVPAAAFRFPSVDDTFSFVLVTSVFTHMLPGDMDHYLDEIARATKSGGTLFATFFLLNDESVRLMNAGNGNIVFDHRVSHLCSAADPDDPEGAVAYEEHAVRSMLEAHGFLVPQPPWYGSWCGRNTFLSYQDILVASKV